MTWVVAAFNIIFLLSLSAILYRQSSTQLKPYFIPVLSLKILAGIALGLIYTYYYNGGDTFGFHHDATSLANLAYADTSAYFKAIFQNIFPEDVNLIYKTQPRALLMAKLASIVHVFTYSNYWLSGAYFSLFSFLGFWKLSDVLASYFPSTQWEVVIAFLFFPSVIFWSSGLMKEPIALGLMTIILATYLPFLVKDSKIPFWKIMITLLLFLALFKLKYYYAALFGTVLVSTILTTFITKKVGKTPINPILLWIVFFMVIGLSASLIHPNLNLESFLKALVVNHDLIKESSLVENVINFHELSPDFASLMMNSPKALFSGLFSPVLWEVQGLFPIIVTLENLALLIFSFFALKNIAKLFKNEHTLLLFALVMYVLTLAALMAFASPNYGTLARYKVGFLPFFLYLILIDNPLLVFLKRKLQSTKKI